MMINDIKIYYVLSFKKPRPHHLASFSLNKISFISTIDLFHTFKTFTKNKQFECLNELNDSQEIIVKGVKKIRKKYLVNILCKYKKYRIANFKKCYKHVK